MKTEVKFYTRKDERECTETLCSIYYSFKGLCSNNVSDTVIGVARQNQNDEYDEYTGKIIAFTRALKGIPFRNIRKEAGNIFHRENKPVEKKTEKDNVKIWIEEQPKIKFGNLNEKYRNAIEKMIDAEGDCFTVACLDCPFHYFNNGRIVSCEKHLFKDKYPIDRLGICKEYIRQLDEAKK